VADFADIGAERSEQMLEEALARHQRSVAAPAISAVWCVDCDVAIPVLRRDKVPGVQTCIDCQQLRELKRG
jgi:phage/conjugal plasmid C-4 type zinc finger TraR family protein